MDKKHLQKLTHTLFTVLHIVMLIIMLGLAILSLFYPQVVKSGIDWMGIQIKGWGNWNYLILFITATAESFPFLGAVLPGMNIMILVGGFFVAKQWEIFPAAALLAMLGACLGNALGYFMGILAGNTMLTRYGTFFGAGPRELAWLEKQIHKNGFWFIVGGKFHNLLRSFIPYIAGSHHMSGRKFWSANLFGSSLWAVSVLLVGVFAIENYETVLQYLSYIFGVVALLAIAVYFWKQRKK